MRQFFFLSLSYLIPFIGGVLSYLLARAYAGSDVGTVFTLASMMFVVSMVVMGLRLLVVIDALWLEGKTVRDDDTLYEMVVSRASDRQITLMIYAISVSLCVEIGAFITLYGML